jgi:hypothetical protein
MELLTRTETLLEQDPVGQDDALRELQKELETLQTDSNKDTLEKVFQLFGTGVGTHSEKNAYVTPK